MSSNVIVFIIVYKILQSSDLCVQNMNFPKGTIDWCTELWPLRPLTLARGSTVTTSSLSDRLPQTSISRSQWCDIMNMEVKPRKQLGGTCYIWCFEDNGGTFPQGAAAFSVGVFLVKCPGRHLSGSDSFTGSLSEWATLHSSQLYTDSWAITKVGLLYPPPFLLLPVCHSSYPSHTVNPQQMEVGGPNPHKTHLCCCRCSMHTHTLPTAPTEDLEM